MALTIPQVKQEIKRLKELKADVERKIQSLEAFLGPQDTASNGASSARGGVDIRPTVIEIFTANQNQSMTIKALITAIAEKHQDITEKMIDGKMARVKRTMLEKVDYGKYRLLPG